MSTQVLSSIDTVEEVFNVLETEITALAEYLDSSLFEGFDVSVLGRGPIILFDFQIQPSVSTI